MWKIKYLCYLLLLLGCKNVEEKKQGIDCLERRKNIPFINADSIFGHKFSGYGEKLIKISDFDSIYRYESHAGWGQFDDICTIYREKDTANYKVQLIKRPKHRDTTHIISERTLTKSEWQFIQKQFNDLNFYCLDLKDKGRDCIDCDVHYIAIRQGKHKRGIKWGQSNNLEYKIFDNVRIEMLEVAHYPMAHLLIYTKKVTDSIELTFCPSNINYINKFYINHNIENAVQTIGSVYEGTIHKRDINKLNDMELVVELLNGKIYKTTEKQIEKRR